MTAIESTEKSDEALPEDLQIWRDEGRFEEIDGHNLFVHASDTAKRPGHGVLLIHGFPGSSIDWKHVFGQGDYREAVRCESLLPEFVKAVRIE